MKRYTPIEVVWRDSMSNKANWLHTNEAEEWSREEQFLSTLGYFFDRDARFISVVQSRCADDQVSGLWQIPLGCVVKIRRLK